MTVLALLSVVLGHKLGSHESEISYSTTSSSITSRTSGSLSDCNNGAVIALYNRAANEGNLELINSLYAPSSKRFDNGFPYPLNNGRPLSDQQRQCYADVLHMTDQINQLSSNDRDMSVAVEALLCASTETEVGGCINYGAVYEFDHHCRIAGEHYYYSAASPYHKFVAERVQSCLAQLDARGLNTRFTEKYAL